jgi:16S rRNA (adenine1518-N6/adenine1519-N6)-dimethyltransferase
VNAPDLLTPSDVRRLLDEHGLAPRRAAGQNFVVDPNTVRKVVRDAAVGPDDLVLEIGPGLGSLTLALAAAAGRVIAVEIDAGLHRVLEQIVGALPNVEIVHGDALDMDLDALVDGGPARLVANLPYNVATPLVMHALEGEAITDLHVMVQREVADRWVAQPGDRSYGAVSVKLRLVADAETVAAVPRTVFHPVPNVDSVTVRIERRADGPSPEERVEVTRVVEAAFAHRRKTLRNTLRSLTDDPSALLHNAGIDPGRRGEELGVEDFRRLARERSRGLW